MKISQNIFQCRSFQILSIRYIISNVPFLCYKTHSNLKIQYNQQQVTYIHNLFSTTIYQVLFSLNIFNYCETMCKEDTNQGKENLGFRQFNFIIIPPKYQNFESASYPSQYHIYPIYMDDLLHSII